MEPYYSNNIVGRGEVVWLAPWAIKLGTTPGVVSIVTLPPELPRTSETLTGREELARHLGFKPRLNE